MVLNGGSNRPNRKKSRFGALVALFFSLSRKDPGSVQLGRVDEPALHEWQQQVEEVCGARRWR